MKLAAVVLAAGKGTRMKSDRAKVLHRVAGRPMIEYPVMLARSLEAERIVCVLGHQADAVKAQLESRFGAGAVEIAIQAEQKGTGHAVAQALPALAGFDGPVLILYGDVPLLPRGLLTRLVEASQNHPLGIVTVRMQNPFGYGRIVRDHAGRVSRVVEEKDADGAEKTLDEVNAGVYCVQASFLGPALGGLSSKNAQGELYLTDIVARAAEREAVPTVEGTAEDVMGVNDRAELSRADAIMRGRITLDLMKSGVTIYAPETVLIDHGVVVGPDCEIGPLVQLRGQTVVGSGVRIEAGCVVEGTRIEDGAHLKPYTVIESSTVGKGATIGPFAHLRPESDIGPACKIGNFVEIKKARFGKGAKASHLSYIGDADIGADVNLGCGTITCNYDGYNKHKTVIGEGAFIGSDSQLVAPVTVGAHAVIASGTTVVEDVPEGALAIARVPQVHKAGYYEKKKQKEAANQAARKAKGG